MKSGSVIDIIAPSGAVDPALLPKMKQYIEEKGYIARIPPNILGDDLFSAQSQDIRFQHLKAAIYAEDSSLIWCARGGTGATSLIPRLASLSPPLHRKTFVGFSDITALHLFLSQQWGWKPIHGPVLKQMAEPNLAAPSRSEIEHLIFQNACIDYLLLPLNTLASHAKNIEADLTGGCLTLVECSLGTPWQIQSHHKILLLEEVSERAYRIDRSLTHLAQAGVFKDIEALILGDFIFDNPTEKEKIEQTLQRFTNEASCPVYHLAGMGHGSQNHPWGYGPAHIRDTRLLQPNPS